MRKDGAVYGFGANCTHYGGPIGEGRFDDELVR
jgi:nitrite reductase/ring-hydroxylating ferredoxin subunit